MLQQHRDVGAGEQDRGGRHEPQLERQPEIGRAVAPDDLVHDREEREEDRPIARELAPPDFIETGIRAPENLLEKWAAISPIIMTR